MQMHVYGEDGLTLWALTQKLDVILEELNDKSNSAECRIFYRPSFGRSGGDNSSQFGEFDFILLSKYHLYLGESKWDGSSVKTTDGVLALDESQVARHGVFKAYVRESALRDPQDWDTFKEQALPGFPRPMPGKRSLLAENLQRMLGAITRHYDTVPEPVDVLLYFYREKTADKVPRKASNDFTLIPMEYEGDLGNYVTLEV